MPTYFARANGNVNAAIWATTPSGTASDLFSSFTSGDVLMANSFTVTLNVNTTVAQVRNDTFGGATTAGGFTLNNGVTLTAGVLAGGATCVTMATGASAAIVGSIAGSSTANNANGVLHNSSGLLTVTGDVTGGSSSGSSGILSGSVSGVGPLTIIGNITGGGNTNAIGVSLSSFAGVCSITGTVTGGTNAAGLNLFNSTQTLITGSVIGAATAGVLNNTAGGLVLTGRVRGGPLFGSAAGIVNTASSNGIIIVDEAEFGDTGASPTQGAIRFSNKTSNVMLVTRPSGTKKTLVDTASTSLLPDASNVRSGTVYNAGQTTGTCAVPPASSVLTGVPVDNTVGTASVSSAAIQSACGAALTAFSSGRLANVATVASTGQQIADAVGM